MNLESQEEYKIKMLDQLKASSTINYKELLGMTAALQIVVGQDYGAGTIMALLDFVSTGRSITVMKDGRATPFVILSSRADVIKAFKNIDERIDIKTRMEFKEYFGL